MFYRVGKFKHELGKTDEIMDFLKVMRILSKQAQAKRKLWE